MESYLEQFEFEKNYLCNIKNIIQDKLDKEYRENLRKKNELISARKDMYENTVHAARDFERISDAVQYLNPLRNQTYDYEASGERIVKLDKMLLSPYFARIDFCEGPGGSGQLSEKIYIGLGNLTDDKTQETYICDWRAPISSIFYRYGLGNASYKAPYGMIVGQVTLKRQYEIKRGELQYFFDSSLTITDDLLKQALSQNSSAKMKSIVETIQKEQDIIIRDMENDILIVQGVAGSGKTSVALHRVAFLMYHGLKSNLHVNNIALITPNHLFGQYIDSVLPELGEKNIRTITMEDIFEEVFSGRLSIGSRNSLLEEVISTQDIERKKQLQSSMAFKLSQPFMEILERYLKYYERKIIEFSDIFYHGECIANRHLLKAELLNDKGAILSLEKRLSSIENRIMRKIQEKRKEKLPRLEHFISNYPEHIYEIKPLARLLSIKKTSAVAKEIYKFSRIDIKNMYERLMKDRNIFYKMAEGMTLPENIEEILTNTCRDLSNGLISYEDGMVLLYLQLKVSREHIYKDIKQVVVDEAQDYYPMQYGILKLLFPHTKYTIMGDINQTIEKEGDLTIYDRIKDIFGKKKCSTVYLNKSFRCSYEINKFSLQFSDREVNIESFDRHESSPQVIAADDSAHMEQIIVEKIKDFQQQGYQSTAIICKTFKEAQQLYLSITKKMDVNLVGADCCKAVSGVSVLPVYMAKGLEFDTVIIYQTNADHYKNPEDRKLLYISSTRALHRLALIYTGERSQFVQAEGLKT